MIFVRVSILTFKICNLTRVQNARIALGGTFIVNSSRKNKP